MLPYKNGSPASVAMQIRVEYHREAGTLRPCYFFLKEKRIDVVEIVDRWLSTEYAYFKVLGNDSATYILKHQTTAGGWSLTLFDKNNLKEDALNQRSSRQRSQQPSVRLS